MLITDNYQTFSTSWLKAERALTAKIRSRVRNQADQEDVLQSIALEAWKAYPALRDKTKFVAWCGAIATRHITRLNQTLHDIRVHEYQTDTLEDATSGDL